MSLALQTVMNFDILNDAIIKYNKALKSERLMF